MNTFPAPVSAKVRRHSSGLASVELVIHDDEIHDCRRCEIVKDRPCNATGIGDDSPLYVCRHRIKQEQLAAFLFGDEPATAAATADDPETIEAPDASIGFSSAGYVACNALGCTATIFAWTDDDWAEEAHKPVDAWPIRGGGRLWATIAPRHDQRPVEIRPRGGAPAQCSLPRWLDVVFDFGDRRYFYRISLGLADEIKPSGSSYPLVGKSRFAWIDVDCEPCVQAIVKSIECRSA